jgi:hypothetical protein
MQRILVTQIPTAELLGIKIQLINVIKLAGHKLTLEDPELK